MQKNKLNKTPKHISAWMAGVADSDGSFCICKRKKQNTVNGFHYRAIFQLTWVRSDACKKAMELISKYWGGNIAEQTSSGSSLVYKYCAESTRLIKLIKDIKPYLVIKQQQAENCISLYKIREEWWNTKGRSTKKPKKYWDLEEELFINNRKLNDYGKRKTQN